MERSLRQTLIIDSRPERRPELAWTPDWETTGGQPLGFSSVQSRIEQCEPVISHQETRLEGGFVNIPHRATRRLGLMADIVLRKALIANRSASTITLCAINLDPDLTPKSGSTTWKEWHTPL